MFTCLWCRLWEWFWDRFKKCNFGSDPKWFYFSLKIFNGSFSYLQSYQGMMQSKWLALTMSTRQVCNRYRDCGWRCYKQVTWFRVLQLVYYWRIWGRFTVYIVIMMILLHIFICNKNGMYHCCHKASCSEPFHYCLFGAINM